MSSQAVIFWSLTFTMLHYQDSLSLSLSLRAAYCQLTPTLACRSAGRWHSGRLEYRKSKTRQCCVATINFIALRATAYLPSCSLSKPSSKHCTPGQKPHPLQQQTLLYRMIFTDRSLLYHRQYYIKDSKDSKSLQISGFPKLVNPKTKVSKTLFGPIKPTNPSVRMVYKGQSSFGKPEICP